MRPLLADASVKPSAAEIAWTRDAFLDRTFVDGRGLAVAACAELACFVNAGTRLARSTTQLCAARPSGCIRCTRPAPMRALAMPPSTPM